MGTNKALLPLAGKPLVEHAVTKLHRICAPVKILSNDPALSSFGPLVPDVHPQCGPMSGIEAALLDSGEDWNLIVPVDVPFLTTTYLDQWLWAALHGRVGKLRIAMLATDAIPHPTLLIIHREVGPYLSASLEAGNYKLFPALRQAALALAARDGGKPEATFWEAQYDDFYAPVWKGVPANWWELRSPPSHHLKFDPFLNVNSPEDFTLAEQFSDQLDT